MRTGSFKTTLFLSALTLSGLAGACSRAEPEKAAPTDKTVAAAPADKTAAAPAQKTADGTGKFGKVTEGPTVTPGAILADIDAYAGKPVRLEGTVEAVCEKAGCWMQVAGADGKGLRVKVKDGEVVFPLAAKGKRVIAEGTVVKIPADPAADSTATCAGEEAHANHAECARPAGATARLDGVGATIIDS